MMKEGKGTERENETMREKSLKEELQEKKGKWLVEKRIKEREREKKEISERRMKREDINDKVS